MSIEVKDLSPVEGNDTRIHLEVEMDRDKLEGATAGALRAKGLYVADDVPDEATLKYDEDNSDWTFVWSLTSQAEFVFLSATRTPGLTT